MIRNNYSQPDFKEGTIGDLRGSLSKESGADILIDLSKETRPESLLHEELEKPLLSPRKQKVNFMKLNK